MISKYLPFGRWQAVGLAALLACSVQANTLPDPLLSAVQTAVSRSPDVQERWRALLAADRQTGVPRAAWLPQVDAQAAVGRERFQGSGTLSTNRVELSLTQLLFDGGAASGFIRQADAQRLQQLASLQQVSEDVAFQVFRAYVDVLRQRELVSNAATNVIEHKQLANMLQERVQAQVARGVDFQQATGRLALAESTLVQEVQALHAAETRYLRFVGQPAPGTLPSWPERLTLAGLPDGIPALLRAAYEGNPSLRAASQSVQANAEVVDARRAGLIMPRVEARLATSRERNTQGDPGQREDHVMEVVLRQNLYRGGGDAARLRQAEANWLQANEVFDSTCRNVRQAVLIAYKDVATLAQQMELLDRRLLLLEQTQVAYRQQFDIGQRTLLDLLDSQNETFEAQRSYANARYDQLIAQGRTLSAMGQLIASLGVSPVEWQDLARQWPDNGAQDPVQRCPSDFVEMARLEPTPPRAAANTFVVLIPDDDGRVGAVVVGNTGGNRVLDQPNQRLDVAGSGAPVAVSEADIRRDFGDAIQARPPVPEQFTLFFRLGSTQLTEGSEADWAGVIERLKARQPLDLTVAGHTDTVGSQALNDRVAQQRADEIVRRLRASGVDFVGLSVIAFGERQLLVPTADNTNEPRNRRVEITAR